jgi:rhamnogalacturonyl hydrolase YesR
MGYSRKINSYNMKRRYFIQTSLASGALLLPASGVLLTSCSASDRASDNPDDDIIKRVTTAMLTMQRATWEQGVAAQAFLELGDDKMVYLLAKDAAIRQGRDGRLGLVQQDPGATDPAANGEPVLYAARISGDPELIEAGKKMIDYMLNKVPRSKEGIIYHQIKGNDFWIDSMYMCPPFLSAAGHPDVAIIQIEGYRKYLWNPEKKLYHHMWNDELKEFKNAKFWGVGNGWALAGIARVIDSLPKEMSKEKDRLISYVKEHIDGCLSFMRTDGLFHNLVDQPESFVETNLSQMTAYTIFRGITSGWLPSEKYLEKAKFMRQAVHAKVDKNGFVQGVAGYPGFQTPSRATEGQAFFLLMEAAWSKIQGRSILS